MDEISPHTEEQLADVLAQAAADQLRLRIAGHGTRSGLGKPVRADALLRTRALAGITEYQPEELVLSAYAGTSLADIEQALAQQRQMLPFEPPRLAALLAAFGAQDTAAMAAAAADDAGTLGGVVAAGLAGPRQILRWSVRDHVLGFQAVNGRGELFKAGGKVVKNVTGYDLPKLMCASFGTLAVLTHITVRVLPAPERVITLLARGLSARQAVAAMTQALGTPAEVSAACWLPAELAGGAELPPEARGSASLTCLRLEGFAGSLKSRAEMLRAGLKAHGDWELVEGEAWAGFWAGIRDARPMMAQAAGRWLWRIILPAAGGGLLAEELTRRFPDARLMLERGGGLVWLSLPLPAPEEAAAEAGALRQTVATAGGQAMLFAAPDAYRATVQVFAPQTPALAALQERVRAQFDPFDILNPGIMG